MHLHPVFRRLRRAGRESCEQAGADNGQRRGAQARERT
jgi:hypothetical protein